MAKSQNQLIQNRLVALSLFTSKPVYNISTGFYSENTQCGNVAHLPGLVIVLLQYSSRFLAMLIEKYFEHYGYLSFIHIKCMKSSSESSAHHTRGLNSSHGGNEAEICTLVILVGNSHFRGGNFLRYYLFKVISVETVKVMKGKVVKIRGSRPIRNSKIFRN